MTARPAVDDIWLVDLGDPYPSEPAHHRPAVVIGPSDEWGGSLAVVIVVPMTTTHRALDLHIEVEADDTSGLDDTSYAQCEPLRAVSVDRLVIHLGEVPLDAKVAIDQVVRDLLDH